MLTETAYMGIGLCKLLGKLEHEIQANNHENGIEQYARIEVGMNYKKLVVIYRKTIRYLIT